QRIELRLAVGCDFADLFEIKDVVRDRSARIVRSHTSDELAFSYRNGDFAAETRVRVAPPPSVVDGDDLIWRLDAVDEAIWAVELDVPFQMAPNEVVPARTGYAETEDAPPDDATTRWYAEVPSLATDADVLRHIAAQTARDLLALRVESIVEDRRVILP